ncbi:hypothetical protein NDA16_000902 [Ustilago loliicola]|nr:hypothetical protein NDA16_000902 [Ustilago loliicola]
MSTTTTTAPKTNIKIVFGCMTFGAPGAEQARVHDLSDCRAILDIFSSHGHTELDTARMYGLGSSEDYLRQLGYTTSSSSHNFQIATKCFPSARKPNFPAKDKYTFSAADITRSIDDNEVDQIVTICDKHGYIKPTVYQGLYNSLSRTASSLFPTLRKHSISYYAYNPLLGGLFTGTHTSASSQPEEGSRFDPNRVQGQMYRARYWQQHYFDALDLIRPLAEKNGLSLPEVALRWMMHHSELNNEAGDAVIIGASSTRHIEQNLKDFEKGPLPEEVAKKVDEAWEIVKPNAPPYHH